ncbi:unnamed protein product [Coregonus sp. 'balchen']|nr:unnamed protein product [Coregonus sp. 'balchen']
MEMELLQRGGLAAAEASSCLTNGAVCSYRKPRPVSLMEASSCLTNGAVCSYRKPRPVSQLVAQQVAPQFASPTLLPKKDRKDRAERNDKEPTVKKNSHKKMRPRLKNIDRSSAQHLEVTVGDLTVIITDFKEKTKPPPSSSSTTTTPPSSTTPSSTVSVSAEHHSGSSSDNNAERGVSRSSSPRGEDFLVGTESH